MVKEYGMSDKAGQVYFAHEKRNQFLNVPGIKGPAEYSEATAEMIDQEIKDIIQRQYGIALDILNNRRSLLEKGAKLLLDKETITGEELIGLEQELVSANTKKVS
jgi:cell division protease FtsH